MAKSAPLAPTDGIPVRLKLPPKMKPYIPPAKYTNRNGTVPVSYFNHESRLVKGIGRLTHLTLYLRSSYDLRNHVDREVYDADMQEDGRDEPPRFCESFSRC